MMKKRVIALVFGLVGIGLGLGFLPALWELLNLENSTWLNNALVDALLGLLIFLILAELSAGFIIRELKKSRNFLGQTIPKLSVVRKSGNHYRIGVSRHYFDSLL